MNVNAFSMSSGEFFGFLRLEDSSVVLNASPIDSMEAKPHPAPWVLVPANLDLETSVRQALEESSKDARQKGMDYVYASPLKMGGKPYLAKEDGVAKQVIDILYLKK